MTGPFKNGFIDWVFCGTLVCILSFFKLTLGQHIHPWDVEMNYSNAGYASQFTIPFMLDSGISSSDYLKVVFPFKLHITQTNNVPDELEASYAVAQGDYMCGNDDYLTAQINVNVLNGEILEPTAYYISFFDVYNSSAGLIAGQYYYLKISITGTSVNIQAPGIKSPLQLFSLSALSSNAIVYDRNPSFATLALGDYPLTEMSLTLTFQSQTLSRALDSEYYIYVDICIKQTIVDAARVELRFLNNDFQFTNNCSTGSQQTNPYIAPLPSNLYSCKYNQAENIVVYTINRSIEANDYFRFIVYVQNPPYVSSAGKLQVRTLYLNTNTIVELQESEQVFNVDKITYNSQNMQLGWGLEYSASSASFYPFNLQVMRQSSTVPSYIPYNAFLWDFSLSDDLPDSSMIQVQIAVPNKLKTFILPGSISNTLPAYTGMVVSCYLNTLIDPTQSTIICKNVGKMYSLTHYKIGCRITFPYDLFMSPLEPNFGKITLYSIDPLTGLLIGDPLSESKNPISVIATDNNPSWALSTTNLDYTVFSTAGLTETVNTANLNTLGAIPSTSGNLQQFIFTLSIPVSTINSTPLPPPDQPIANGAGLIILTNPNVISLSMDDSPTVVTSDDATLSYTIGLYSSVQISDRASYRKIKIYAQSIKDLKLLVNGAGNTAFFKIKRGRVLTHTSFYADQYLLDFYIATFDQINSATPVFKNLFLYNGYTINVGGLLKLKYGVSNYWTTSLTSMSGSTVPVILRIAGYFKSSDLGSARDKIVIFFKNLEPFYGNSTRLDDNSIACNATLTYSYSCSFFTSNNQLNGQSYINYNRIEISLNKIPIGSSEKFQIIIPMKSFQGMQNDYVSIYIGGMKASSLYTQGSNLNQITQIYRLTGKNNIATNQLFTSLLAMIAIPFNFVTPAAGFGWTIPSSARVGANNINLTYKIGGGAITASKNNQNIANLNGGSFTLCSEWNFFTSSSTVSFSLASSENTGSCMAFSYAASFSGTTPSYRYGLYCPFETGSVTTITTLLLNSIFLPYINGKLPPLGQALAWSNNDGLLKALNVNPGAFTLMSVGLITIQSVSRSLIISRSQEYVSITFLTTNPIIQGNVISINFLTFASDFTLLNSGVACTLAEASLGILGTTCTSSISGSVVYIQIVSCSNCLTSGGSIYTLKLYGIEMSSSIIVPLRRFGIILYASTTYTSAQIVDQSKFGNNDADLKYAVSAILTDPTITLTNLVMGCYNQRCRSSFKFNFQFTRRLVSINEQFRINLGGYAKDNTVYIANLVCHILDSTTGKISFDWLTMDMSSLIQVAIIPKAEILENSQYIFYCDGARTPYSTNPNQISGFVSSQGSVQEIYYGYLPSSAYSPIVTKVLFPSKNLVIKYKNHNNQGSNIELKFKIISSQITVTPTCFIYVSFPTTYSPNLTSDYIYCLMNSIFVDCTILQPYTILISSLPVTVAKGTAFYVQIYGVEQSSLFQSDISSIFIGLSNTASYQKFQEAGDVNDVQPGNPPERIFFLGMSVSNNYIRSSASYGIKVRLPAGSVLAGNYLYLDFPNVWDRIINYVHPLCYLRNPSNTTNYASTCTTFGNRITLPITQTDTNANNFYYLVLENLRNPDQVACEANEIRISVSSDNGSTVQSRSAPSMRNANPLSFTKNPNQINLKWTDPLNNNAEITKITCYVGVFNNKLSLTSDYGSFVSPFYIYMPDTTFYSNPAKPPSVLGYESSTFQIAASRTTTQGLFLVQMEKSNDENMHTNLPFIKLQVIQQLFTISQSGILFRIPVSGHSQPILFDMSDNPSIYESIFAGSIFDPLTPLISAAGLSFVNRSSLVLNYLAPKGFFMIISNENSVNAAGAGTIKVELSAITLTYYNNLTPINYAVVPNKIVKPIAKLATILPTDKGATHMTITGSCNQDSTFYYLFSTDGARKLNPIQIIQRAWTFVPSNLADPYNYHTGFKNIFVTPADEALTTVFGSASVTVKNLKPSMLYNITGFCSNGNDLVSDSVEQSGTTRGNSGIFLTISFTFSEAIKQDMAKQLACYLVIYFKVPAPYLRTEYDDYCDSQSRSRFLLAKEGRFLQQVEEETPYLKNMAKNRFLSTAKLTTKIYIYPISDFEKDSTTPNIQIEGINEELLKQYAYNNVTGLPAVLSITQPVLGEYIAPQFVNQTDITASPGLNYVNVTNIQCDKRSILYLLIDLATSGVPTYYDIRSGYNTSTSSSTSTSSQSFQYSQGIFTQTPLEFNFDKLLNSTAYVIYYYAASDDPSISQPRTSVQTLTFTTASTEEDYSSILSFSVYLLMIWWILFE